MIIIVGFEIVLFVLSEIRWVCVLSLLWGGRNVWLKYFVIFWMYFLSYLYIMKLIYARKILKQWKLM